MSVPTLPVSSPTMIQDDGKTLKWLGIQLGATHACSLVDVLHFVANLQGIGLPLMEPALITHPHVRARNGGPRYAHITVGGLDLFPGVQWSLPAAEGFPLSFGESLAMETNPHPDVRTILIVKTDRLYAEALRQLALEVFPAANIRLAWSIGSAQAALAAEPVELLVTGIGASLDGDALDFLSLCMGQNSCAQRVLVVTTHRESHLLAALRALPIHGVFDSAVEQPEQFLTAIQTVAQGNHYWSRSILDRIKMNSAGGSSLSRLLTISEQLILSVIGDGSDNVAAASELGLSPATVSSVRRDLHRKLGVQHRGELMRIAAQSGFVQFTPFGVVRPGFAMLTAEYNARKSKRGHAENVELKPFTP